MDEQNYRISLLEAANQKLVVKGKMYNLISKMADNAYLYYDFETNEVTGQGDWSYYFPIEIETAADINRIGDGFGTDERIQLNEVLSPEASSKEFAKADIYYEERSRFYRFYTAVVYDENERPLEKCICVSDVTDIIKSEEALKDKAFKDNLTGLVNYNHFSSLLEEFIKTAKKDNSIVSVILVDIDGIRDINQTYGRPSGDELIRDFSDYLKTFLCERVIAARLQMDLFAIALLAPDADLNAHLLAQKINQRFANEFITSASQKIAASACIGVAEYPEAAKDAASLIKVAEVVLYRAKTMGKSSTEYYSYAIIEKANEKRMVESRYNKALAEKSFFLNYQPQYSVSDKELRGVEVLVRWLDVDGNIVPPNVFIPMAEKNGTIVELGKWILENAIATYAQWKEQLDHKFILGLNISSVQYGRPDFVSFVASLLNKYDVNPKSIEIEITERALLEDWEELSVKLTALRSLGLRLALDDFGSNYSSINILKNLPLDTIKLRKSFFMDDGDDYSRNVTKGILALLDRLGVQTVALGIEHVAELDVLYGTQCKYMQGFLWGSPLSADGIMELACGLLLEEFSLSEI